MAKIGEDVLEDLFYADLVKLRIVKGEGPYRPSWVQSMHIKH